MMIQERKEAKTFCNTLRKTLKSGGDEKPEFDLILQILEDTYTRYLQIRNLIDANGVVDRKGTKNSLLNNERDCLTQILKLSQKLGLSVYDAGRIKKEKTDDTEDFIDSLCN